MLTKKRCRAFKGKKAFTLLLSVLAISAMAGCGNEGDSSGEVSSSQGEHSTVQSGDAAATGISEEVKERLTAVLEQEPIAVPADGWTDETLLDVLYINGEKLEVPFSLENLGEGFDFMTDDENFLHKETGTGAVITYYGIPCGMCSTAITSTIESFPKDKLNMITFDDFMIQEPVEMFPISVNGVTYGTSYNDMVSRLGLTVEEGEEDPNTSTGAFTVFGYTESYRIKISGGNAEIDSISFALLPE